MSIAGLAFQNFKTSARNSLPVIFSLGFTILVFYNLMCLTESEVLSTQSAYVSSMISSCIYVVELVLVIFMVFYIHYCISSFFEKQKKSLGLYIFMGLSLKKTGSLCLIEILLIGLSALVLGCASGVVCQRLFLMIIESISGVKLNMGPLVNLPALLISIFAFWIIYLFFSFLQFIGICRSSVLELVSASRRDETVKAPVFLLVLEALLGIVLMGWGFYLAVSDSDNLFEILFLFVLLICAGIYLLFGGLVPLVLQSLQKNKRFLYQAQRNLWINSLIFRIRRNYRTYAVTAILLLSSLTALLTGLMLQQRKDIIVRAQEVYTVQLVGSDESRMQEFRQQIDSQEKAEGLMIPLASWQDPGTGKVNWFISASDYERMAEDAGLDPDLEALNDQTYLQQESLVLMTMVTAKPDDDLDIDGTILHYGGQISTPVTGSLPKFADINIVTDGNYDKISRLGQTFWLLNWKLPIEQASKVNGILSEELDGEFLLSSDAVDHSLDFVSVVYAVSYFIFLVFIITAGSILFMRTLNDGYEDVERIRILKKLGISQTTLSKAAVRQIAAPYLLTFGLMAGCSIFVAICLEKTGRTALSLTAIGSVAAIGVILLLFDLASVASWLQIMKNSQKTD